MFFNEPNLVSLIITFLSYAQVLDMFSRDLNTVQLLPFIVPHSCYTFVELIEIANWLINQTRWLWRY